MILLSRSRAAHVEPVQRTCGEKQTFVLLLRKMVHLFSVQLFLPPLVTFSSGTLKLHGGRYSRRCHGGFNHTSI
jgi:hypothetical protein